MADEIQNTGIQFEDIVPWVDDHGDTGLSARLKLKRNFDKIKAWMDANHIDVAAVKEIIEEYGVELFLSKLNDDTAAGFITMLKGLQIGANFVPDILGEGGVLRMREDGKVELVTDILYARVKAYFDSVEIREYQHTGGNRIASVAGNKICRVAWFNSSNVELEQTQANLASVAYFRCYFRASDGEDTVRNNWVVGDLAYCHVTSIVNSSDNPEQKGLNQKHLWRLVIGRNTEGTFTEDGEAYIDLSNRATETISGTSYTGYQSGSGAPEAQDDIIQLGNVNDTTRQGAIVEFVTGTDAPSYQIYQGINSFSLNNKNQIGFGYNTSTGRAYLNVYGDFRFGARPNTQGSYLEYNSQTGALNIKAHVEFTNSDQELNALVQNHQPQTQAAIAALIRETEDLQAQIDGAIESYFMEGEPSLTTPPVMNTEETHYEEAWLTGEETQEERIAILNKHIGDLYYDKETGHGYRFLYDDDTSAYVWAILTDEDVTEALRLASEAQETADGKSTTFLNNTSDQDESKRYPTNYKKGDTWILQADATIGTTAYKAGDILTASTDSETYSASHWSKQVRYTDDTKADSILNNTYYKQLAGGTINNLIGTAQDAADAAQDAADAAQADATNANNKLTAWADDGNISPTEKLALKNQKADVQKEYAQIIADAAKYSGVSTTAFTTAYNRAITAFDYYTSTSTENIDIITDEEEDSDETPRYSRIADYYAARQTILEAITTAAKSYATTQGNKFLNDAVYKAISAALGSKTDIVGGLVLTSLIGMRQQNEGGTYTVWGGISGEYDDWSGETHAKGHGIAAWYGGELLDKETLTTQQIAQGWDALRWAKGVDRFDGSGYRADGNISWNENGALTIKNITTLSDSNNNNILNELATFNSAFTFGTSGQGSTTALYITPNVPFESLYIGTSNANKKEVATQEWVGNNYVSTAFFRQLFRAFKPNETAEQADVEVEPNTIDNTISNIKAMVGLWTEQYISALGRGADGGGGGQGDVTWAFLASTATGGRTIDISYLANALNGYVTSTSLANTLSSYATQSWVTNQGYALQTSVDALEFLNSVSAQNNKVTLTTNKNNSTILDFTHEHVWSEILDKPSTLQGYGIFDTYIGNGVISINGVQITPLVLDDITDKDTSLSYGTRSTIASVGSKDIHVTMPAAYSLPTASSNALGGVQIGFTTDAANRNYAVLLSGNKAYVNVPWTDTVYTHPSGGADTTISAANGRVLSAITVNGLGHTTSVSYKALTMADMPSDMKFFNTIANVNDGIIRFAGHNITAQDVDFSHEHTWADILDKPASLAGFGIDKNDPLLKENYLTIEFFERLFNAYNGENIVHANSTSTIDSIKAMFGFWTEQYISALGRGADGGGAGQGDVTWAFLASTATGGRTIDISYLANALNGYVTSTSLANTLSSYATQSWVTNQGYALQTSVDALEFLNSVSAQNDKVTLTTNKNNSTILDFTHEHVWSEILDKPSTLQGYGIFDTYIGSGVISINGVQITPLVLDDVTDKDVSLSYGTRSTIASVGSKDIHVTMPAAYSLPTASSNALGGVQIGFTTDAANRNYAVLLSGNKAYVNVPWTDTVYTHPSGGADTTISAANGRVLSAITVNGLGHTTSVSYKALTMADMPSDMKFFNTIANVNDGVIRFTGHNITAQDVDFYHEHTWADILDKPASLAGFGIDKNDPLLKENYLTIEFFERLFNAYNGENIVHANSTSTIDSIKAMFGFWTEQYISALGLGDDGEAGSFNESQMWNALGTSISVKRIASTYLEDATRFNAVTGGDNHINLSGVGVTSTALDLTHEHSWWEILDKPSSLQGYGIYDTYIEGTTVYIGGAHIDVVPSGSVDLTGYAKESWVSASYQVKGNYLTSADLSGYLPKIGGIMTGDISRRMTADTSNYENAIKWINFSAGKTIAAIGYHNTVQKIYLNPVGSSEIYNDAVGKYSLVIGNNTLTYNTKEIATQEWVTGHAVRKLDWWSSGDSHSVDSLTSGTTFAYTSHGAPTTGTIVAFSCTNNGYPLQIQGSYSGEGLYFRNYNGDNGTWKTWRSIIHSGNIGSQTVSNSDMVDGYHASSFAFVGSHNNLTASGNEFTTAASGQAGSYWINYRTAGGMNGAITIYTLGNGNGGRAALDAGNITANGLLNSVSNGVTIQVGAQNSSWAHITNNANVAFYFNNSICTDGHLYPYANNTYSLGTSSNYWAGAYIADINIGSNRYYGDGTYGINMNNSDLIGCNSIRTMDLSDDYTEGLLFARTNGNWDSFRAADSNFYFQYNNGNNMMQMNTDGIYLYSGWLRTYGATGWYNQSYGGGWYMQDSTWIRSYGGKYVWVDSYLCAQHISAGTSNISSTYALYVSGVGYFSSGVYSDGYVSALSDARHKEIVSNTQLTVEQIANMRSVLFRWKDGKHDNGLYVGSIAQDWEKVLPQVVGIEDNAEQTRSLQYGVAALVSAITTARKVVDHEKRIRGLERENRELKEEIKQLKMYKL